MLDRATELALISLPGVVRLLDDGRGQLVVLPEEEIRRLQRWSAGGLIPARATAWLEQTFRRAVSPGHGQRWTLAPARMNGVAWPASRRGTFPYLVAHDTLIGVAIRFRPDATGLAHCQQALTQLGELSGAPDQRRDIVSAPETRAHTWPAMAGPPRPFSTVQRWCATRETEATVEIACPAHAQSFAGYLQWLSTARAPQPPGVSVTSALP